MAARRLRVSVEDFATKAVARAVADVEQWTEEETAYAEYEKTGEAIPIAAVEEWVRSWGTPNELPPPYRASCLPNSRASTMRS